MVAIVMRLVAYTATETHDNLALDILDRSSETLEERIHSHVDIFP